MKKLILILSSLALINSVSGQTVNEIYNVSQQSSVFSTARVAGLGGAYTSLGADVGSININPAGIAMYKSKGAFSITPSLNITSATGNSYNDKTSTSDITSSNTRGELANIGFVYNAISKNSSIKNVAFGFSYNSNYSNEYSSTINGVESGMSILDMFSAQLYGKNSSDILDFDSPYLSTGIYGAVGAYNAGLLFGNNGIYGPAYLQDGVEVGSLVTGDRVLPELIRYGREMSEDYSFALGFNVNDVLYIGTTLGYSEYHSKQFDDYSEYTPNTNHGDMDNMLYGQSLYKNGASFNFIFGLTAQLTESFKLGASIQAPKLYRIDEEYSTYSLGEFYEGNGITSMDCFSPVVLNDYTVKTPTRLNVGASYVFGKVALLSVDYERVWNNSMKVRFDGAHEFDSGFNKDITSTFKPSDNLKLGAEINIPGNLALRAGYGIYGCALKDDENTLGTVKGVTNISAGLGYRLGGLSIDLTYVNINTKTTPFRMFNYYSEPYNQTFQSTSLSNINYINHNVMLTLTWRI